MWLIHQELLSRTAGGPGPGTARERLASPSPGPRCPGPLACCGGTPRPAAGRAAPGGPEGRAPWKACGSGVCLPPVGRQGPVSRSEWGAGWMKLPSAVRDTQNWEVVLLKGGPT